MYILILLFLASIAQAQMFDARTISHAGVIDLSQRYSSTALHGNPAILGPNAKQEPMTLEALSFNAAAVNNAFSVTFWNDQIARDHYLTAADKRDIMDRLSGDELRIHANASAPLAGITYRQMAASVTVESALNARAPKEVFELALYGNELNRAYDLGDFEGESYTLFNIAAGFSYKFEQEWIPELYGGIGFHFYQGIDYEKVVNADGELTVTDSLITGYTIIQRVRADYGDGVGFDLGGLAVLSDRWKLGASLRQVGGTISWDINESELQVWESDSAGIIIDSLDDDDYLERVFQTEDAEIAGGTYSSELPVLIGLDSRYEATSRISLMGSLLIRSKTSAQGDGGLEAGVATEVRARPWLPLHAGFSAGGSPGWQFGIGGGLRFKSYEMTLGWTWNRGLFNAARGVSFGLSQQIRF
ncbi:hypothetical protein KKC97_08705 [bacterium]|nr:hypothetical protein [bacterium]